MSALMTQLGDSVRTRGLDALTGALLGAMSVLYTTRPSLRRALGGRDGPLDFGVGITTRSGSVAWSLTCRKQQIRVHRGVRADVDVTLRFTDEAALLTMLRSTPADVLDLILKDQLRCEGSWTVLQRFNYLVAQVTGGQQRVRRKARAKPSAAGRARAAEPRSSQRHPGRLSANATEPGVRHLEDAYLSAYNLDDFPRLVRFLDAHLRTRPEICPERPVVLTE